MRTLWLAIVTAILVMSIGLAPAPALAADKGCSAASRSAKKALKHFQGKNSLKASIVEQIKSGALEYSLTAPKTTQVGKSQFDSIVRTTTKQYIDQSISRKTAIKVKTGISKTLSSGLRVTFLSVPDQ